MPPQVRASLREKDLGGGEPSYSLPWDFVGETSPSGLPGERAGWKASGVPQREALYLESSVRYRHRYHGGKHSVCLFGNFEKVSSINRSLETFFFKCQ